MLWPRSSPCVFVVLVLLVSAFVIAVDTHAAAVPTTRMGGFADSIVWSQQPNQDQALVDLQNGAMDLYAFPLRTATTIAAAHGNADLRTIDNYGVEDNLFANPVPVNQTLSPGVFNPFALADVRQALNYLIDRDYINEQIFGGYGLAHTAVWNQASPEAARDPFFFDDMNRDHAYNYARAHDMIFAALNASGATYDGTWTWQGNPIVVNIVQRTEDQRFQIGQYVATQVQSLGLQANLLPMTAGGAFAIVYNGPPDTGAWMLYTEGWSRTWLQAWPDDDLDLFHNGGDLSTIWSTAGGPYHPDPELSDIAARLRDGNYGSVEDRQRLVERGSALALNESVRVWLVASQTFAYSNRISDVAFDLDGGPWSAFAVRTARFATPGGTLHIGNRFNFVSPWQPWQGFSFIYDSIVGSSFMDPGLAVHPHTGEYVPVRANFQTETAGTNGSLGVPSDALLYNPATGAWESVGPGATARSRVTFNYTFGTWHHGPPITMNDVLYNVASIARRAAGDIAAHDPNGLSLHDGAFASIVRGVRVLDPDTLEVYVDYSHLDPSFIAAAADVWPATPWEVGELAMATTLHDHTRVSEQSAAFDGLIPIDLSRGPTIDYMDREITDGNVTTSGPSVTRPAGFSGLISQAEAEARWAALQAWRVSRPNYFPSNGPYYLDSVDVPNAQAVVLNFGSYPFPADRWDMLLSLPTPELSIDPISDVAMGQPAQMVVRTALGGQPSDNASVRYRIVQEASGIPVGSGQPSRTGPGTWEIDLSSGFTANLTEGMYRLEAAASSTESSVTVFANRTFNVTSSADTTAPTSAVDSLPSYWQTSDTFQLPVTASDDGSGVAWVVLFAAFSPDGLNWSARAEVANDTAAPFTFSYAPPQGDGRYRFWSVATDLAGNTESLSAKPPTGDIEGGLDGVAPTSSPTSPAGYWQPSSPFAVSAAASDTTSGVASVQLYVSYSTDGASWSPAASVATDASSPFQFLFTWTQGNGRYRFWSIATDVAGNVEMLGGKPSIGDFEVGVDSVAPSATLVSLPSYWQTALPVALQTTLTEATSGVASVDLYASESADGVTWSTPAKVDTDSASPFAFSYAPTGDGRYRLWALATDQAGNAEALSAQSPDGEVAFGIDRVTPTAAAAPLAGYWHQAGPLTLDVTASDATSGVASVALYVSFSADGSTWSDPTLAATDSTAPYRFTYLPDQGDGRYRFWALATDAAGNTEVLDSQPGNGEAEVGVDSVGPTVVSSEPSNGATDVSVTTTTIRIRFSEPVDHSAAETRFTMVPSVSGSLSWDGNTLVYTPSKSLAPGTSYRVTVQAGVTDVAGNALGTEYTISFATASPTAPPGISGTVLAATVAMVIAVLVAIALLLWRRQVRKKSS